MLKRHLLLASVLAGTFAITACSQQTEENAEAAVESAGDDVAANANMPLLKQKPLLLKLKLLQKMLVLKLPKALKLPVLLLQMH